MATERNKDPSRVRLKDVRLSFAHLFKAQAFGDGDGEPKFNCNFLIDPSTSAGKANLKALEDAIEHVKDEKWPKGAPKLAESKVCLRDGNNVEYDGYEEMMFVSANNAKKPRVLDRDKVDVEEGEDGCPYSGCYVDGIVRVWAQDNKWGKRINASLEAVRFRRDGEAFGAAPVDPDEFDDIDDDEGDDRRSSSRRGRDDDEGDRRSSRRGDDKSKAKDKSDDRRSSRRGRDDDEGDSRSSRRGRDDDEGDDRRSSRRGRDDDEGDSRSSRRGRDDDEGDRRSSRRDRDDDEGDRRSSRRSRDEDDDRDTPSRNSRSRRSRDDDDVV